MFYDLTIRITPKLIEDTGNNSGHSLAGHLGTHFDVMNKVFPLDSLKLNSVIFDVSDIRGRDITEEDIDISLVKDGMSALFCTGYVKEFGYGSKEYYKDHIQLSDTLIDSLLDRGVKIIGIDASGIRHGKEHTPKDQYCADRGVFVVENLCNMEAVLDGGKNAVCTVYTFPVNYTNMSGLPCRVVAEK